MSSNFDKKLICVEIGFIRLNNQLLDILRKVSPEDYEKIQNEVLENA